MNKQTKRSQRKQYKPVERKICPNCQVEKAITQFGRHKEYGKERVNSWCRACQRENNKRERQKPGYRERHATYMREYRKRFKQERLKPE